MLASVAFVFPGQGSQAVGMGADLFAQSAAVRALFAEADEVLGVALSRIILEGPEHTLRLTYHSEREGLAPMVEGLIIGLGKRFGQVVQISLASPRGPGRSHDVFEVSWTEA